MLMPSNYSIQRNVLTINSHCYRNAVRWICSLIRLLQKITFALETECDLDYATQRAATFYGNTLAGEWCRQLVILADLVGYNVLLCGLETMAGNASQYTITQRIPVSTLETLDHNTRFDDKLCRIRLQNLASAGFYFGRRSVTGWTDANTNTYSEHISIII